MAFYSVTLKDKLQDAKERKVKQLTWKLSQDEVEFIKSLGYRVEEYLYQIKTKQLTDLHNVNSKLMKEIHFASKRGVRLITFKLTEKQKEILDEYGIKYRPYKYKIFLNPSEVDEAS